MNRVAVAPASGRNLSANIVLRARAFLVAAAGEMCPGCQVIDAGATAQATPIDVPAASTLAGQFSADVVLALDLDRAQSLTRLTLVAFPRPAPDGRPAQPQVLSQVTNEGPDALWPVVRSLVGQLYRRAPETAAGPWATGPRPAPASPRRFFLEAGAAVLGQFNTAGQNDLFLPGFGLGVAHHADTALFDVRLDLASRDEARRTGVGLSYAVRTGPYWSFGLAASWVWMHLGGRGANGPALAPLVGYLVPITGGPSIRFEAGYTLNLFRERQVDRLIPGSDAAHWSHGPQLLVGVAL